MRRIMLLVTVALVMAAMMVVTAGAASARAVFQTNTCIVLGPGPQRGELINIVFATTPSGVHGATCTPGEPSEASPLL